MLVEKCNEANIYKCLRHWVLFYTLFFSAVSLYSQELWVKPDFAEVSEDVSVRVRVLMNDRQLNQTIDSSSLSVIHDGRHGHAVFERDKALIKYTPNRDFYGIDSFRYQICNNSGECQQTTAVIKVHAVNDAPIARDDAD
ncbi:MAG: hypothetical protein KDC80_21255, partial [Saprospiraceae bacterium]|nr:hypothetical protein [Saprospiraceae bacterium]